MTHNAVPVPGAIEPTGEISRNALAWAPRRIVRTLGGVALVACFVIAAGAGLVAPRSAVQAQRLLGHQETSPIEVQSETRNPTYREAPATGATSADARHIQASVAPLASSLPKSLPFLIGALAALLLAAALVISKLARAARTNRAKRVGGQLPSDGASPAHEDLVIRRHPATVASAQNKQLVHDAVAADDLQPLADRIVAVHVPGQGLHIVVAGVPAENTQILIDLARVLAEKGRSIIVDLDHAPARLAPLASADEASDVGGLLGLSELLIGDASYAEVIHRDHASRLHFIPTGGLEADFRDFDLILDALTLTYDFIVMLAPAYPRSEIAKIMAPYADFVVLAPVADADGTLVVEVEHELTDAGAREVLVAGRYPGPLRQQVA